MENRLFRAATNKHIELLHLEKSVASPETCSIAVMAIAAAATFLGSKTAGGEA